ncbi:PiggyBac transposable element-derived protein 4, partial [Operophtera brumata]
VDIEKWLEDLGDDVVDKDDLAIDFDVGWSGHDYVTDAPATLPETLNLELTEWLTTDDLKSDRVLTDLLPIGHLTFDWTADHNTFTGQREQFKGTPGPTFPVDVNTRPVDIFLKYFDDDLLELIVRQTNRHATYQIDRFRTTENSRLNKWTNTDKCEITTFLAILIFQGLAPLSVESHYWKETGYLTLKYFKTLMTYNRFLLLKRLLNFSDSNISVSTDQTQRTDPKLRKIWPVLSHLQKKFSELYLPGQEIAIDESLLKWQGRLSFAQKIATKAAKVGVKTYELCESSTGYLWNFYVYTGKDSQQPSSELQDMDTAENSTKPPAPTCATARIVLNLVNPLLNLGHTLVMDNFYNSPLLARYLKSQGTDCYGTLRINREFVPESIKSVSKNDMRVGEVIHTFSRDVSICLWRDNNLVSMLSTYHENSIGGKEKYGRYKYKPQIVLDYNLMMGGVDKKDQLLSAHPIERSRNIIWYKKVFRRLLNITIVNSYVVYKIKHPNTTQRAFREKLAEELVGAFRPLVEVEPQPMVVTNIRSTLYIKHYVYLLRLGLKVGEEETYRSARYDFDRCLGSLFVYEVC